MDDNQSADHGWAHDPAHPGAGYDTVVLGGGAAGLSGALTLARARRRVLVLDAGRPRNAPATGVYGLLTRDGVPPAELVTLGAAEVRRYGGTVLPLAATTARPDPGGFTVTDAGGGRHTARRLLLTTGLLDELPDVPGLRRHWGRDVLHCPYCHGWEVRDRAIGVLATGPRAVHQALLFRQWSTDVTLFTHTAPDPTDEQREQLAARGVTVVDGEVDGEVVEVEARGDGRLAGVRLASGRWYARRALVVTPRMVAGGDLVTGLGLRPVEHPLGLGEHVEADASGRTPVDGVWAAGNVVDLTAKVVVAAAAGVTAAAAINADLVAEDTRAAVQRRRAGPGSEPASTPASGPTPTPTPAPAPPPRRDSRMDEQFTAAFWDDRYRSTTRVWSGRPNPWLVTEVADLPPGTAWDAGCGEGADAVWLADRGWRVTATDVSAVALDRAADHAGAQLAGRVTWRLVDLAGWVPDGPTYDLVSAHFLHFREPVRVPLYAGLAASVAPGGTLLVVGHDHADLETSVHRHGEPDMFFTAAELAAALDPARWEIVVAESRPRVAPDPDGQEVTVHDVVLRARRRR